MSYLRRIEQRLEELEREGLRRTVRPSSDYARGELLDFSSNDYLGLSVHPDVVAALRRAERVGSGGSRLLAGAFEEHRKLEEDLATFTGRECALLFSSGYHAALGAIGALAHAAEACWSDRLNHASLIDAIRTTRLVRHVYPHLQFSQKGRSSEPALVVTESLFGVDGDVADLPRVLDELGSDDILFVDEAHALGVLGTDGRGLAYEIRDSRVVVMGTLSKAFGAHGGFVAGPEPLIDYLQSAARAFIFDTALPPAVADAARAGVRLAREARDARANLLRLAARLRKELIARGYRVPDGIGPIVPVIVGDVTPTLELAARLREGGINAPPIRPPTVPEGTCRLRITLRATHTDGDIDRLLAALS